MSQAAGGWRPKRFWKEALAAPDAAGGWAVLLDGRPVRTPAKLALCAPGRALAEAVAAEWAAQGEYLDPESMPLTRALNLALDRVPAARGAMIEDISAYGGADLLCHRAPEAELAAREAAEWGPVMDWAAEALGARLSPAIGLMPQEQSPQARAALRRAVEACSDWELVALHELTTLSGSILIALAVSRGRLSPAEGWRLSRIDEDWQAERWGLDSEAAAKTARREAAFHQAARLLALARPFS